MREKINCVYIITNKINGKIYIGSSIDFHKRMVTHKRQLLLNKHHSQILQKAYNKYGLENFNFEIFQYTKNEDRIETEDYYIKKLNPEYNIALTAGCPMMGRKHTEEAKKKFSEAHKGNKYTLGLKYSQERKDSIVKRQTGTKRSIETRLKMRETALRKNRVESLDKVRHLQRKKIMDSDGNLFESLVKCAKFWNLTPMTICDILKGRHHKTKKGITFKYV